MSSNEEKEDEKPIVAKTATDLQRLKLLKLMKNPEKPVILPERPKAKNTPMVPEFVRNVMGSSAGAGSGEFHVYRHLRRKEYARQKFIQEKGKKELLDVEYHKKLEENKRLADELTAKKRAKRLKKKQRRKEQKKLKPLDIQEDEKDTNSESESDVSENNDAKSESATNKDPDQSLVNKPQMSNEERLEENNVNSSKEECLQRENMDCPLKENVDCSEEKSDCHKDKQKENGQNETNM